MRRLLAAVALSGISPAVAGARDSAHIIEAVQFAAGQEIVIPAEPAPLRPLPFGHLLRQEPRPNTIEELEEALYRSIPENHLRFIATYLGLGEYASVRSRYPTALAFSSELYDRELLDAAWRAWGFSTGNNPFDPVIRCVGEREFSFYVILQVGFRYIADRRSESERGNWDLLNAHQGTRIASRRLLEVCWERLKSGHGKHGDSARH